jgi:hypothetical protein
MMLTAFGEDQAGKRVLQELKVPLIAGGGVESKDYKLKDRALNQRLLANQKT